MNHDPRQFDRRPCKLSVDNHLPAPRETRRVNLHPCPTACLQAAPVDSQAGGESPVDGRPLEPAQATQYGTYRFTGPVSLMYFSSLISTETDLRTPSIHLSKRSF